MAALELEMTPANTVVQFLILRTLLSHEPEMSTTAILHPDEATHLKTTMMMTLMI